MHIYIIYIYIRVSLNIYIVFCIYIICICIYIHIHVYIYIYTPFHWCSIPMVVDDASGFSCSIYFFFCSGFHRIEHAGFHYQFRWIYPHHAWFNSQFGWWKPLVHDNPPWNHPSQNRLKGSLAGSETLLWMENTMVSCRISLPVIHLTGPLLIFGW